MDLQFCCICDAESELVRITPSINCQIAQPDELICQECCDIQLSNGRSSCKKCELRNEN